MRKVKMKSLQEEYIALCIYFGEEFIESMFRNYKGYKEVRGVNTYQEVYNKIDSII